MAVANQKGGVGKTTTVVNLAACLGQLGKPVLVVDGDAQGNATTGLGVNKRELGSTLYEVLLDQTVATDAIVHTAFAGVDILPSNVNLAGAEIELVNVAGRERRLKDILRRLKDRYELILIDCPPSLGLLTLNALVAADGILVPIQCEFYALEGLSQLIGTVRRIQGSFNPDLDIEGVVLTMFDGRTNLSTQVADEVRRFFKDKVFSTVIPRNVRLSEAPSHGQPISTYDAHSKGAELYAELAREVLQREHQEGVG